MCELWYEFMKSNYGDRAWLCCIDTHSLTVYIQNENAYENVATDAEVKFEN